ncbi:hypothetical protein UCRNP2_6902 [Neofusicoccum parvum UCRNP2]|uniref:Uncharacterized protein n=1 Tax=Botryosphaeria parva (strain UCR-NP2) TaxID=1287680 RepID=R1EF12_BOTPV|nr:hypothetical protein UCRNP2_6902 [Neofusicoccum parvum UCRNP2]
MYVTALAMLLLLFWARPSQQHPSNAHLRRSTGCACATNQPAGEVHTFWLQPPPMENPGDTCRRLAHGLEGWLQWIDGHADLPAAWQLYDDILQNRRTGPDALRREALEAPAPAGETKVSCAIEGMVETRDAAVLADSVLLRVLLGAVLLVVLFESVSTIWR